HIRSYFQIHWSESIKPHASNWRTISHKLPSLHGFSSQCGRQTGNASLLEETTSASADINAPAYTKNATSVLVAQSERTAISSRPEVGGQFLAPSLFAV